MASKYLGNIPKSQLQELALLITQHCVRNTVIERYHAEGKLSDPEMCEFNKEVANKLYTALLNLGDAARCNRFIGMLTMLPRDGWDTPMEDPSFRRTLDMIDDDPSLLRLFN